MDAGLSAIVGAAIGAVAGIGGAWRQGRSTRDAAREADSRRRDGEARDRIRTYRVREIEETRSSLARVLDWHELRASGRNQEATALDKQFWSPQEKPGSRVMNLSLLGDDGIVKAFIKMRADLDARSGGSIADVDTIQNMRVIVMAQLNAQERAALADKPLAGDRPPDRP